MATPEGRIKSDIKNALKDRGVYWTMIPGGAYGRSGEPDMILCCNGRYLAVEVKTPTGRQSEWQKLRQAQIEASGGTYIVARDVEDVLKAVERIEG